MKAIPSQMKYEKSPWQVLIDHPIPPLVYSHKYVANPGNERLDLGTVEERETEQPKLLRTLEGSLNVGDSCDGEKGA